MGDINATAKQFVDFYYSTFDTNREQLRRLYRNESMLTWEGSPIRGVDQIVEKFKELPFKTVQHKVATTDAQPSSPTVASLMVLVSGLVVLDDSASPLQFTQAFQLIPDGNSFYVYNDVFRLNYGS